jgi:Fe-S cluster assembly protein SufB
MKPQHRKSVKKQFFFFTAGICLEKIVELMVSGFCRDIFTKLPLEFAAEADKLLTLKLEGSVG